MKKIVITGGGTAGHVYPALAIAEKLKNFELHYLGSNGMEKEILKNHQNIIYHEISAVKLQRRLTFKNFLIPFKLIKSIRQAKQILKSINPSVILSKGGFVAVPVAIAGRQLKIPVVSHESDLSFGLANKIILKSCSKMCTTFAETCKQNQKCVHTGQPLREKIFHGKKLSFFDNNKPCLLVLGGSLGAKFLNNIVFENLEKLTQHFNVLHICGKQNFQNITHKDYKVFPYAQNIEDFYATATIVLSRAGSGVINELLVLQKPMALIPLSKKCSRGDQIENAQLFKKLGYAEVLEEEDFSFDELLNKLIYLTTNKDKIAKNMQKSAKNDAVDKIVEIIESYIKQ